MSEKLEALLQAVIDAETDTSYCNAIESLAEAAPQILALIKARTPAPEGEGKRLMLVDLDGAPFGSEFLDNLNGYATGGSGRCLDILTMWGATLYASPVVPVGVSREEIAKALFERHWSAVSASPKWPGDDDGSYWLWLADAILAVLRPTDTGGE
jgi:hypothetical protein